MESRLKTPTPKSGAWRVKERVFRNDEGIELDEDEPIPVDVQIASGFLPEDSVDGIKGFGSSQWESERETPYDMLDQSRCPKSNQISEVPNYHLEFALAILEPLERSVIVATYGLDGPLRSDNQIAILLHIRRSRVVPIREQALELLKHILEPR